MEVTKIEEQKRKNRYNVYIDGNFWGGISASVLTKFNLYSGKNVDKEMLDEVYRGEIFFKLYDRAVSKITRRQHSVKEISIYLRGVVFKKKKDWFGSITSGEEFNVLSGSILQEVIDKLLQQGLLSDIDFANWWVKNRMEFRPSGWYKVKTELIQKGVAKSIIDELGFGFEDELIMAQKVYDKLVRTKVLSKEKVISRLQYRGFGWDIIEKILKDNDLL